MTEIRIATEFVPAVRSGRKTTTIRSGLRNIAVGPGFLICGSQSIPIEVTEVRHTILQQVTDADARADGFSSIAALHFALHRFYPTLGEADPITIITFHTL